MRVVVDVFSGRPNPTWSLDPAQREELLGRLAALAEGAPPAADAPGLGYRGVEVGAAPCEASPFDTVRAAGGAIEVQPGSRRLVDPGRALERWLIESGAPHLPAAAHAELRALVRFDG